MPRSSTSSTSSTTSATAIAAMAASALIELVGKLDHEIIHLRRQVAWFPRQIVAQKSERRLPLSDPEHGALGEGFTGAYVSLRERRADLKHYPADPVVRFDTNPLERVLRVIPMRRKNWLVNWPELGAKHIGIMQSLSVTCRAHDIDPYDYLVDAHLLLAQEPAFKGHELTPRFWKILFASNPLGSDLYNITERRNYAAG